jgi:hypothetical protein
MFLKFRQNCTALGGKQRRRKGDGGAVKHLYSSCLRLEPLESRWLLDSGPLHISEFMASNDYSVVDKFGNHSDWIEIYNPSGSTQALDGWYLTDDPDDLTKWRFPDPNANPTIDVPIDTGGYLLVFASNEDLSVAGQELHTNFKIDAGGGYLALVQSDGTTIASQYNYPEQITDVSYGLTMSSTTLVSSGATGATAKVLVPDSSTPSNWMQPAPAFDDSSWSISGTTGIGFDNLNAPTLPAEVESNNTYATANTAVYNFTAYTGNLYQLGVTGSIPTTGGSDDDYFKIGNLQVGDLISITLSGVASSRGTLTNPRVQLYRSGSGTSVASDYNNGPGNDALIARYTIATDDVYYIRCRREDTNSGTYQLGVMLEKNGATPPATGGSFTQEAEPNDSMGSASNDASSSWRAVQYLSQTTGSISTTSDADFYRYQFTAGDLVTVNINSTSSLNAKVTLLKSNGTTVAALEDGSSVFASPYDLDSPLYAYIIPTSGDYYVKVEGISSTTGAYGADLYLSTTTPPPSGEAIYDSLIQTDVDAEMSGVNSSAYIRIPFSVENPGDITTLTLRMKYDDGFVAYLNGVEVARRNAPGTVGTPLAWNAAASAEHIISEAVVFEDINISSFKSYMGAGNLLAIQGLNLSSSDNDFLILPELAAFSLSLGSPQYFFPATPEAENTTPSVYGQVSDTQFSVDRGFYDAAFDVSITSDTPGAVIRYTVNGRDPQAADNTKSVSGITRSGATATATCVGHAYAVNDWVQINGANQSEYNGIFVITSVTADTFSYTISGTPATPATGTITAQDNYYTYTGPIHVATTTTLRAAAYKTGYISTNVDTVTYIFLNDVIHQPHDPAGFPTQWINKDNVAAPANQPGETGADYEMDPEIVNDPAYSDEIIDALKSIPSISLVMNPDDWFGNGSTGTNGIKGIYTNPTQSDLALWERETSMELINSDGSTGFQIDAGIQMQGGASREPGKTPKHSFTVSFESEYEGDLYYPLFGSDAAQSFDSITLRAGFNNSWTHWDGGQRTHGIYVQDEWGARTQLDMGDLGRHGSFVHLYINGLYWGVYNIVEKPDADFAVSYMGGEKADYDVVKITDSGFGAIDGNITAYNAMIAAANAGLSTPEAYANFQKYLNIPSFIDYMIDKYYAADQDWDHHNWVAIRRSRINGVVNDTLGGFFFINWDGERVLEATTSNKIGVENINYGPSRLFNCLKQNAEFRLLWADRLHEVLFNDGALIPTVAAERLAQIAAEIDSAMIGETARWGDYRRDVYQYSSAPYNLYTRDTTWVAERDRLLNSYFPVRTDIFLTQNKNYLVNGNPLYPAISAPEYSMPNGGYITGLLSISDYGGANITYYTLDGSDPRVSNTVQWVLNTGTPLEVKSVTLSGTTATVRLLNHALVNGQTVAISGANESQYNTTSAVIFNVTQDTFDYTITGSPASPASGTIYVTTYGITRNGTAAIVTLEGHGFANGDLVLISGASPTNYNGIFTISNVTVNTFSYIVSGSPTSPATGTIYVRRVDKSVSGITYSDTLATATVDNHGFVTGDVVRITGATPAQYNGEFIITYVNANTFTYTMASSPGANASGTMAATRVVSPTAIRYTGPITLAQSAQVKARVLNGTTWSALDNQPFFVNTPASTSNLAVTEVNYNPVLPDAGSGFSTDDFQFIELQNTSSETIDLTDVQLTLGYLVAFDFAGSSVTTLAPGAYVLIAGDLEALVSRYGSGIAGQIAGEFSGDLNHNSERLYLHDYLGQTIVDFTYNDSGDWPGRADGKGSSLEIVNTAGDYNDPDNWRSSGEYGGSPGQTGAGPIASVVVNEVLNNADIPLYDSIELYNTTDASIDISGWYLSDSSDNYKKYLIPEGTVLSAHQYLVVTAVQFGPYFGLSSAGEDVWLLEADTSGNLTYFTDHVEFGAAISGESFGRWPNGTGVLYPMINRTFGQANDIGGNGPRIGPLLISEVMYNPAVGEGEDANDFEYVEIFNPTSAAVDLSDWQLSGGVDFTFDLGTTIAAKSTLLVLPFNPSNPLNEAKLANFQTKYGIGSLVMLVGGFGGQLANGGETIDLLDADGVLEDEIDYNNVSPWPVEADGGGSSLQRVSLASWGDDAASWIAAAPAPGTAMMIALDEDWSGAGLTLKINSGDGLVHLYQTGTTTDVAAPCTLADITSVDITGRDNIDDVLTIDFSNGDPIPAGGLIFNGGSLDEGNGNSLVVIGTTGGDSVVMSASQITDNVSAPIFYSNIIYFEFNLAGGSNSLAINGATLKINQDNAISSGTDVTIDNGTLDLDGHTDTIGDLLLTSGSIDNGVLHADSYVVQSGTVTADVVGPGGLEKSTTAAATLGNVSASNVTVSGGQLTANSIATNTLTIGAGAKVTIAPIAGGPLAANSALTPLAASALRPTSRNLIAQPTAANTIASPASTSPVYLVASTPAKIIDTDTKHLPPQFPIYYRLDARALHQIFESRLEKSVATSIANDKITSILSSLRDELPSRVSQFAKFPAIPAINIRQAHFAALQTVIQNARWTDTDAEADFDIAQHVRAGKHSKQLENAVDEVLGEEEVFPAI